MSTCVDPIVSSDIKAVRVTGGVRDAVGAAAGADRVSCHIKVSLMSYI